MRFALKRSKTTTIMIRCSASPVPQTRVLKLALRCCVSPVVACRRIVRRAGIPDGLRAITSAGWLAFHRSIVRRRPTPRELGRAHRLVLALWVDAVLHPALGADELLGEGLIGERLLGGDRAVPPVDGALRFAALHEVAVDRGELPPPRPFDHRLISLPARPLYLQRDRGRRGSAGTGGGAGTGPRPGARRGRRLALGRGIRAHYCHREDEEAGQVGAHEH